MVDGPKRFNRILEKAAIEIKNMAARSNIRYPYALDSDGRIVNIYSSHSGESYQCLVCRNPMLAKRGKVRQPHFAHKQSKSCSDPDSALHRIAQSLIIQSLDSARNCNEEYRIGYPCPDCGECVSYNIAPSIIDMKAEDSIVAGTRSDIVLYRKDRNPIVLEIVVTHDLEPDTRSRYVGSGLPVFLIQPTWDSLSELELCPIAEETLNLEVTPCISCKRKAEHKRLRDETNRKQVSSYLKRMERRRPSDPSSLPFRPWSHDKFDQPMFPNTRRRVYANAIVLTELGFIQTQKKPWLFRLEITGVGRVFANFGSTEEVPIWEDSAAMVHWQLERTYDELVSLLIPEVLDRCRKEGAEVRVSFYNGNYDRRDDNRRNDPTQRVNRDILLQLLTESDRLQYERKHSES